MSGDEVIHAHSRSPTPVESITEVMSALVTSLVPASNSHLIFFFQFASTLSLSSEDNLFANLNTKDSPCICDLSSKID